MFCQDELSWADWSEADVETSNQWSASTAVCNRRIPMRDKADKRKTLKRRHMLSSCNCCTDDEWRRQLLKQTALTQIRSFFLFYLRSRSRLKKKQEPLLDERRVVQEEPPTKKRKKINHEIDDMVINITSCSVTRQNFSSGRRIRFGTRGHRFETHLAEWAHCSSGMIYIQRTKLVA